MLSLRRPPRPASLPSPATAGRLTRWAARAVAPVLAAAIGLTFAPASAAPATSPAAPALAAANGTPLGSGTGLYPRAIRLEHSGSANGRVLASVVTFNGNNGVGAIHESTDGGATFRQVGAVTDPESSGGQGLCCSTLFELPRQVGSLAPGTLLWSASSGADEQNRRMALRVWRSNDVGRTWSYLSTCATANGTGGLWEPEFSVAADGALVCHYADETDPAHNQKLAPPAATTGSPGRTAATRSPAPGSRTGRGCPWCADCRTARTS